MTKPSGNFGDGNIPVKGVIRGAVVSYTQRTKGAAVEAPKSLRMIRNPKSPSTRLVTKFIKTAISFGGVVIFN